MTPVYGDFIPSCEILMVRVFKPIPWTIWIAKALPPMVVFTPAIFTFKENCHSQATICFEKNPWSIHLTAQKKTAKHRWFFSRNPSKFLKQNRTEQHKTKRTLPVNYHSHGTNPPLSWLKKQTHPNECGSSIKTMFWAPPLPKHTFKRCKGFPKQAGFPSKQMGFWKMDFTHFGEARRPVQRWRKVVGMPAVEVEGWMAVEGRFLM